MSAAMTTGGQSTATRRRKARRRSAAAAAPRVAAEGDVRERLEVNPATGVREVATVPAPVLVEPRVVARVALDVDAHRLAGSQHGALGERVARPLRGHRIAVEVDRAARAVPERGVLLAGRLGEDVHGAPERIVARDAARVEHVGAQVTPGVEQVAAVAEVAEVTRVLEGVLVEPPEEAL